MGSFCVVGGYLGKAATARSLRVAFLSRRRRRHYLRGFAPYPRVATNDEPTNSSTGLPTNGIAYHTPHHHFQPYKLKRYPTIDFVPALEILINLKSKSCKQHFNHGHKKEREINFVYFMGPLKVDY